MALDTAIVCLQRGDWKRAHEIVQSDETALGCWAHGIVHMLEGDFDNARYWYRRAHRAYPSTVDAAGELAALADALAAATSEDRP
jgi:hypothetical protein